MLVAMTGFHGTRYGAPIAPVGVPCRVRDLASGELRYLWSEAAALDNYRHTPDFAHLALFYRSVLGVYAAGGECDSSATSAPSTQWPC